MTLTRRPPSLAVLRHRCQIPHGHGQYDGDAEWLLTYRGTKARWRVCSRHAEVYRGSPEFVVERLA